MCDEELIAAILEDLGYLDEKKEADNKEEDYEEENIKEDTRNSEEGEQK
ncbi:hypothetical protein MYX76_15390 [Desulfobacterota bacterium AH_259_B03_O07]|nr:hypothetical protein [Desulfobacterota bacterium AH_259_B03_O07]